MAAGLVVLLIFSGILEMGGIFFLFGYIGALSELEGPGDPFVRMYRWFAGDLGGRSFALVAGLLLLSIFVAKNAGGLITSFLLMRFSMKRYEKIATRLFDGYLNTQLEVLQHRGTVTAHQVLGSAIGVFRGCFNAALAALSDIAIIVTMLIALIFIVDYRVVLTGGTLIGAGGYIFLSLTRKMSVTLGEQRTKAQKAMRAAMTDGFRGLIDARLANRQHAFVRRYAAIAGEFAKTDRRAEALNTVPRAANEVLLASGIVIAAVYFAGTPGGLKNALPTLAVAGFAGLRVTAAMSRLTAALQRIRETEEERCHLMDEITQAAPDLLLWQQGRRVDDYLLEDRPEPEGFNGRLTDRISVDRVTFTYPGSEKPALQTVSLEIPQGTFIGFCGPSGGGKSTLALLIMGLLRPTQGSVYCDDWNVFHHLRSWHRNIGYVGQGCFLSPRSVRENVAFGYEPGEIDEARVWRALELASIDDLIRDQPEGLGYKLGEEGVRLSGGQRQRLGIARALYHNPDFLVFDEATAALDTVTEKQITRSIAGLSGTKTVLCIAHRLTTICDCDMIYYIEDGRITASGTYEMLEQGSPAFRRLLRGGPEAA